VADESDQTTETSSGSEGSQDNATPSANFTDAYDADDRQGVMGPDNGLQHRAGPGEGIRAPFAREGEAPQISVFDGKGNESVVVAGENQDGRPAQGSGPDAAAAQAEASEGDAHPGSAFGNPADD